MQQINRNNLSTTADAADIFVIDQPDARFTNFGKLTTSGDLASPIRVAADGVTVTNSGTLTTSGDGSPGVTVGELLDSHYDHVTIANDGTIDTSGGVYDDGVTVAFPDGIDVYGNDARVVNYGVINATVGLIGADSTITNKGSINALDVGIVVDTVDGTGGEIHNTVINTGQIHTTADQSHGIWLLTPENVAKNYGTIRADGFNSVGFEMVGDGNHGENYGTILVTGEISRGVLLVGEQLSFDNYGTVQATCAGSIGVRFSSENLPGTDGGTFTNYGKVVSAGSSVSGVDSDDHVINRGLLVGDVHLGSGDDSYLAGKGGSLNGTLELGDGNDLIVFEKGGSKLIVSDFVAGAGSDDVIDLSACGFHSFEELMTHLSQVGSDAVLSLGGKNQIVLQGVSVGSLAVDDFALGSPSAASAGAAHGDWMFG